MFLLFNSPWSDDSVTVHSKTTIKAPEEVSVDAAKGKELYSNSLLEEEQRTAVGIFWPVSRLIRVLFSFFIWFTDTTCENYVFG